MGRGAVRESMRIPVAYRLPSRPNRKGSSKIKYLLPVCAEHGILPITPDERGSGFVDPPPGAWSKVTDAVKPGVADPCWANWLAGASVVWRPFLDWHCCVCPPEDRPLPARFTGRARTEGVQVSPCGSRCRRGLRPRRLRQLVAGVRVGESVLQCEGKARENAMRVKRQDAVPGVMIKVFRPDTDERDRGARRRGW